MDVVRHDTRQSRREHHGSAVDKDKDTASISSLQQSQRSILGGTLNELIEVRQSRIPGAGRGLFALGFLKKGTRVTYYDGVLLDHAQAARVAEADPSYMRSLTYDTVIDGLREPLVGRGAASFANHGQDASSRNAALKPVWNKFAHATSVVLVTTKDVESGTELLVNYGNMYWKRKTISD